MYTGDEDFYQILGVSPEATGKEIKAQYKKLMLENHPDKFKGLKAKHEAGDEDLLEIIEERIHQAEEESKLINQAFEVLSDSTKRKEYDDLYETTVAGPEIVLSTNSLDLGRLTEGQKKAESFVIENKGGPVTAVTIDWESEPEWGELLIELTPVETFPIKVTVGAKAEGATAGPKKERIFIEVDGEVQTVEVALTVAKRAPETATAGKTPGTTTPSSPPPAGTAPRPARPILSSGCMKAYMTCSVVAALMIIGALVICALNLSFEEKQQAAREQQYQQELVQARESVSSLVKLADVERVSRKDVFGPGSVHDYNAYVVFTIDNDWNRDVRVVGLKTEGLSHCYFVEKRRPLPELVPPFSSMLFACEDYALRYDRQTGKLSLRGNGISPPRELCVDIEVRFNSSDVLSGEKMATTLCGPIAGGL